MYSLLSGDDEISKLFELNTNTGEITTKVDLSVASKSIGQVFDSYTYMKITVGFTVNFHIKEDENGKIPLVQYFLYT